MFVITAPSKLRPQESVISFICTTCPSETRREHRGNTQTHHLPESGCLPPTPAAPGSARSPSCAVREDGDGRGAGVRVGATALSPRTAGEDLRTDRQSWGRVRVSQFMITS